MPGAKIGEGVGNFSDDSERLAGPDPRKDLTDVNGAAEKLRISVLGAGYLGVTHASCLAELGYDVLAVDADVARVRALSAGELPFFEPDLTLLLRRGLDVGRSASVPPIGRWHVSLTYTSYVSAHLSMPILIGLTYHS